MGRETDEERERRLEQAGAWLKAELKKRDWSQRHLADRLGVAQQQISAYARGRYEFDGELARDLARLFEMDEPAVWRGLQLPLPREFMSDEDAIAWALRNTPEQYAEWLRRLGGNPSTRPVDKGNDVTRTDDDDGDASDPGASAI